MDLLLATHNAHKTAEFRELLGRDFNVIDLSAFAAIAMPDESGKTFAENAKLKAVSVSKDRPGLVVADDSGLEVDALGGAPGIYSARYAGNAATDANNIDKLLQELRMKKADERSARFRCVIAVARDGKIIATFEGFVEGNIVDSPRGNCGFGYDPIFQPTGFAQTFGEMAAKLKNEVSHRAKAAAMLGDALRRGELLR